MNNHPGNGSSLFPTLLIKKNFFYLFIWLCQVLVVACGIFVATYEIFVVAWGSF